MPPDFQLARPHPRFERSYLAGLRELTDAGERSSWVYLGDDVDTSFPEEDFAAYVETLLRRETEPAPHFVRNTVYWAVHGDELIGRIGLRHELNEMLRRVGGHIGYIVRPSWRGRGVGTEMLRRLLLEDEARAVGRLLLTCDENNAASERTITRNGGLLEGLVEVGPGRPRKKRFWITLPG